MKKKKRHENISEVIRDEEFKTEAELAFEEAMKEEQEFDGDMPAEADNSEKAKKKPILTESELKVRKARRTKAAVAAFVLLLGVGVLGNWYYENSDFSATVKPLISSSAETKTLGEAEYVDGAAQPAQSESEYFASARVEREKARDEALEKLQGVLDSAEESESAKKEASEAISDISNNISIENKIETLVAAKGVNNCLAVISADGERVDVIVDVPELTDQIILQIKEIAMQQLGCSFENVSIIQSN